MISRFAVVSILGALAGIAAALFVVKQQTVQRDAATSPASSSAGTVLIGGPFHLTGTDAKPVSSSDFNGKLMLVYFGFTHCPDICPAGLQQISTALDKLGPSASDVVPLFISLDPERDTPEKLGAYMKSFHASIRGLTGTVDATAAAAKAYRVYSKKVENEASPKDYSIDHSGFMYLMDRNGKYIAHFKHNIEPDKLAEGILKAIKPAP